MSQHRAPLVVAHRGSNEQEPEHSLAAYIRAVHEGVDAVECDVRLTADGTLVLVHDRNIERTSTGHGVVSTMTLEEIEQVDFSGPDLWHDFEAPKPDETRSRVVTLDGLLEAVMSISKTVGFSIETKHPTRYRGYVELELRDVLKRFGLLEPASPTESRVRVMSFSQSAVRRVNRLMPKLPTVYLMDRIPMWRRNGSLPLGTGIAGISVERLHDDPGYVARTQALGNQVHVWTVDSPEDVRLCLRLGIDAIISNRPAMVRAVVDDVPAAR